MLKNVQALRAIAALLVVFDHINGELANSDPGARGLFDPFRYIGNVGVDLFFAISGFIMVATSWAAFGRAGASGSFLLRRLARIYPPYWLVLLPIVVAYLIAPHALMHAHEGRGDIVSSLLLLPQAHDPLLIVSWTLTFEMFFYLVFATFLRARRAFLLPFLGLWLAFEIAATTLFHGASNPYLGFLATPLPIEFILGAFVGYRYKTGPMPGAFAAAALGSLALAAVWIVSATHGPVADLAKNDLFRVAQFGVPAALVLYGAVGIEREYGSRVAAWLVKLGDASYATYLWHVPMTIVIGALATRVHVHGRVADAATQLASLAVVIGVSLGAYRFFEKPVTARLNAWLAARTPRKMPHLRAVDVARVAE